MRKLAFLFVAFALVAVSFYGCDETNLTEPPITNDESAADVTENTPSQAPLMASANGKAVLPFWATGGNANTSPSSQFLGTLDNQSLAFRTNGAEAMRLTRTRRLGIGTTNPVATLHVTSAGGPLQEVLISESTPGNAASFKMQNTTRTWSLFSDASPDHFQIDGGGQPRLTILGSNGNVGIGTTSPGARLHLRNQGGSLHELLVEETSPGAASIIRVQNAVRNWKLVSDASPDVFQIESGPGSVPRLTIRGSNGNIGLGTDTPGHPLEMASGAHVTAGGVWTDASSRAYKENIRELTTAEARTALNGLTPVQFNYKTDRDEGYVGFIAEDVPDLVATQDRKGLGPMDIVAVLTKVVQQQVEKIAELEARLDALQ